MMPTVNLIYPYHCDRCGAGTLVKIPGRSLDEIFCLECQTQRFKLADHSLDLFDLLRQYHQLAEYLAAALPQPPEKPSAEPTPEEGLAAWTGLLLKQSTDLIEQVEVKLHPTANK